MMNTIGNWGKKVKKSEGENSKSPIGELKYQTGDIIPDCWEKNIIVMKTLNLMR